MNGLPLAVIELKNAVDESATLVHEEHGPVPLARGLYRVIRQREYAPQQVRYVRD